MDGQNPLGIYAPISEAQIKALRGDVPHAGTGTSLVPSYSSWSAWDSARHGPGFDGTRVNYAERAGDPSASSLIMSGVRWLGSTLPEAPLRVMEGTDAKGDSQTVDNHRLTQLWRRPNPYYSGATLMKAFAFSWITKGDVYIRKVRDDLGRVTELWYEPHWAIRPRWYGDNAGEFIAREGDDPSAFVAYYEVTRDIRRHRKEVKDIIHFRDGLNAETRCGHNGIFAILREVFGDNEAANMYAALMSNDGIPKFILVADPDVEMDEPTRKAVESEANRASTGDNRGKVMALSGVKPYKLGWSPKELDLRATRYMSEDRFAAVTGIPAVELELGAGAEHSIYNTVRQAAERATERVLCPLWNYIQDELVVQLLPDFEPGERAVAEVKTWQVRDGLAWYGPGQCFAIKSARTGKSVYVEHDLSKVRALQEDEDGKAKRLGQLYRDGVIMRSEARSGMGYGPSVEGDDEADKVFAVASTVTLTPPKPEGEEGDEGLTVGERPNGNAELIA